MAVEEVDGAEPLTVRAEGVGTDVPRSGIRWQLREEQAERFRDAGLLERIKISDSQQVGLVPPGVLHDGMTGWARDPVPRDWE